MGAADSAAGGVLVRVAGPADQPGVAALLASAGRRPADAPRPPSLCVAATAGPPESVVGYGAWWQVRPGKFRMDLLVASQWRCRGVGSGLLGYLAGRARAAGAATLQARVDVGQVQPLGFLLARGFVETMRMHRQVLQVADARLTVHEHLVAQLAGRGIVIASLEHELARRADCWQEYCRLFKAHGLRDPVVQGSFFKRAGDRPAVEHGLSDAASDRLERHASGLDGPAALPVSRIWNGWLCHVRFLACRRPAACRAAPPGRRAP